MRTQPSRRHAHFVRGAAIAALTLLLGLGGQAGAETTHEATVAAVSAGGPAALNAAAAIAQITANDGSLQFDVAENGRSLVWSAPVFSDGLPSHGATYLSQGYIYPGGTLSETVDGVNADGSPEFPDRVLGQWSCYGWYMGDGAHATEGPWVLSTQLYDFGDAWGKATLVSEGYVLANPGGTVERAIAGGTGPFAAVRGSLVDTNLGGNDSNGGNARYLVTIAP